MDWEWIWDDEAFQNGFDIEVLWCETKIKFREGNIERELILDLEVPEFFFLLGLVDLVDEDDKKIIKFPDPMPKRHVYHT